MCRGVSLHQKQWHKQEQEQQVVSHITTICGAASDRCTAHVADETSAHCCDAA
jgi:hypothetical protein